jgi:hypothetical protein
LAVTDKRQVHRQCLILFAIPAVLGGLIFQLVIPKVLDSEIDSGCSGSDCFDPIFDLWAYSSVVAVAFTVLSLAVHYNSPAVWVATPRSTSSNSYHTKRLTAERRTSATGRRVSQSTAMGISSSELTPSDVDDPSRATDISVRSTGTTGTAKTRGSSVLTIPESIDGGASTRDPSFLDKW